MRFSRYMREWLYGEGGYYRNFGEIGKKGDFYTAVSVSKFFGGAIAKHLIDLIEKGEVSADAYIIEIGAHKGYLLADMIQFIYTFDPELLKSLKFAIVEPFEELRKMQTGYFKDSFADEVELIHFESLKDLGVREAFLVANEIFDAFECELVYGDKMAYVEGESVVWKSLDPAILEASRKYVAQKGELAQGYERFAEELFRGVEKCRFLTFDYGDKEPRGDFSIRVYISHRVYPFFDEELKLKEAFKKSDITYDVNFSHLIDSFERLGFETVSFKTQLAALVDFGITELLEIVREKRGFDAYLKELNRVKTLIHPAMMGERFKMVEFKKG